MSEKPYAKYIVATCSAAALATSLAGCGVGFEGSGNKDAATAEQLAMHQPNNWIEPEPFVTGSLEGNYANGTYTGTGLGVGGKIEVTLKIENNHLTCVSMTQEGETQSVGGFEAIESGRYAAMIDAAQGSGFDTIAGATLTTNAVRDAVDEALEKAKLGNKETTSSATSREVE